MLEKVVAIDNHLLYNNNLDNNNIYSGSIYEMDGKSPYRHWYVRFKDFC